MSNRIENIFIDNLTKGLSTDELKKNYYTYYYKSQSLQDKVYEQENTILEKDVMIEKQHNKLTIFSCIIILLMFLLLISFAIGLFVGGKSKKDKKHNKTEYL